MSRRENMMLEHAYDLLEGMAAFGEKRAKGKRNGTAAMKIYSYSTYKTYRKMVRLFIHYCFITYGEDFLPCTEIYIRPYIRNMQKRGLSSYTQKTTASALGKLFQRTYTETTCKRQRANIKRSRRPAGGSESHFSMEKHAELVNFIRKTGLRRCELLRLYNDSVIFISGEAYIKAPNAKGGRKRNALVLDGDNDVITRIVETPDGEPVWPRISKACPCHRLRAEYAAELYKSVSMLGDWLERKQRYDCRKDMAGVQLDREGMRITSHMLGHSRITIVASDYLYTLNRVERYELHDEQGKQEDSAAVKQSARRKKAG